MKSSCRSIVAFKDCFYWGGGIGWLEIGVAVEGYVLTCSLFFLNERLKLYAFLETKDINTFTKFLQNFCTFSIVAIIVD